MTNHRRFALNVLPLAFVLVAFAASSDAGTTPCVPPAPRTTCVEVTFFSDRIPQPFAYTFTQRAAPGEEPTLYGVTLSTAVPPVPKYEPIAIFDTWTGLWSYSYHGIVGTSPFYAVMQAIPPAPRTPKN